MESEMDETVRQKAIAWFVRLKDGGDDDWFAFEAWLAEDPAHVAAFHRIEDIDLDLDPVIGDVDFQEAANDDDEPPVASPSRRRWLVGGAIAAALVLSLTMAPRLTSDRYDVYSRPGEIRVVTLDAGTRVTLNGDSRMTFDRKDARFAALASGEALFEVRHDPARPFRLEVGGKIVEDAGTVFNVAYEKDAIRVAVAEGKVVYDPGSAQTALGAGEALEATGGQGKITVSPADSAVIGTWRKGQLTYSGAPLSLIAGDLSRALGVKIRADASVASRPYFGTIAVRRGDPSQLGDLMTALDVVAVPEGNGKVMKPRGDDRR